MTNKQILLKELTNTRESAIRSELALHGYEPSPMVNKEVLINMLLFLYFGEGD